MPLPHCSLILDRGASLADPQARGHHALPGLEIMGQGPAEFAAFLAE